MDARVVYSSGDWKKAGIGGQTCDRHPSAKAQARVILPSLGTLYFCQHCADTLDFGPDFHIDYEAVNV